MHRTLGEIKLLVDSIIDDIEEATSMADKLLYFQQLVGVYKMLLAMRHYVSDFDYWDSFVFVELQTMHDKYGFKIESYLCKK